MKWRGLLKVLGIAGVILFISLTLFYMRRSTTPPLADETPDQFTYTFNTVETLGGASDPDKSSSPYWWLNSGGELIVTGEFGQTIQGELGSFERWRRAYALTNPSDTDDGVHPQNIFRLVSRTRWENVREQVDFRITAHNLSDSRNRNESNGLLLMSRYRDGDNLYYGGIRVDGTAIIKKKYDGTYYTLAQRKIFPGSYNASSSPSLLPSDTWISVRMETVTRAHTVHLSVALKNPDGSWDIVLTAEDTDKRFGNTPAIVGEHRIGIRTDFMDVQFKNFHAEVIDANENPGQSGRGSSYSLF